MRAVVAGIFGCIVGISSAATYITFAHSSAKQENQPVFKPNSVTFSGTVLSHNPVNQTIDIRISSQEEGEPTPFDVMRFYYDDNSLFIEKAFFANDTTTTQGVRVLPLEPADLFEGARVTIARTSIDPNAEMQSHVRVATLLSIAP